MIAGFNAAVITSPVDVIKSRVMSQKIGINGENLTYSGTADYFVKIVKTEGLFGTLGFFPNWMRIGPHTIVTFLVYEQDMELRIYLVTIWIKQHYFGLLLSLYPSLLNFLALETPSKRASCH